MSYRRLKDEEIFDDEVRIKKRTFTHQRDHYIAEWSDGAYDGNHRDKENLIMSLRRLAIGNHRENNLPEPQLPDGNYNEEDVPTFGIADKVFSFADRHL